MLFRVGHWPPNPDTNYRYVGVSGSFDRRGADVGLGY